MGRKTHVVKYIVHIGFFQSPCCKVVGPFGRFAHPAIGYVIIKPRFQMGTDLPVHGQRHIVPADIPARFLVGTVVQLNIQHRVGFQASLGGDLVVLGLPFQKHRQGGFLCRLHDFRVVLRQIAVHTLRLHLNRLGFRCQMVADKQGRAIIKLDRNVARPAPFAGTGRGMDFAGLAAKSLRDHVDFLFQGQALVAFRDFHRFFLQGGEGLFGWLFLLRRVVGRGGFWLRRGFPFWGRLWPWCCLLFGDRFLCWLLLFLGV